MIKVLHVIPSLSPVHGGPSRALPIMERALSKLEVQVETATTNDEGAGKTNQQPLGEPVIDNGVNRWYFKKQTEFYKVSRPFAKWFQSEAKRFDLIHVHALFSYTSVVACRIARSRGVPFIIRPLGVLNRYGVKQRRSFLKGLSLKFIEGPLLKDAAAIHFTSKQEQEEAELLGIPFKSVVIPLGLEPLQLLPPDISRRPFVLFLSRLDPKKNVEGLLEVWSMVVGKNSDWDLVIAGSGDASYLKGLVSLAKNLGISGSVNWPGHVTGEAKAWLLSDASVFVLPSHSENFGIAAAEALLAGKPCVFTEGVAVGKHAAAQGAAIISQSDPQSLSKALLDLMLDQNKRNELSKAAKEFAERELRAEVMGERLKNLYESIIASKKSQ